MSYANEIVPRLWLGNKTAAADEAWLKQQNITVVFNCTKTLPFANTIRRMYRIPVDDNLEAGEISNLADWAAETQVKLYREYQAGRNILVHCHAGMQRSAAVVAMFLMTLYGMNADEAMRFVKSKRSVAFFPVANFERAIRRWDTEIVKIRNYQDSKSATKTVNAVNTTH